ncbi:hypothetical protein B0H66DRAFT_549169 [Apodospora peruviana]|uniref:Uncharacterized protein n=1 Tax=Apodospora peruviana TaxID=516989 RepID=A0AAE0IJV5_9PEZI|nr:hypothetical protein B0H66DRAFT_549169 [Apodospora peruviana]
MRKVPMVHRSSPVRSFILVGIELYCLATSPTRTDKKEGWDGTGWDGISEGFHSGVSGEGDLTMVVFLSLLCAHFPIGSRPTKDEKCGSFRLWEEVDIQELFSRLVGRSKYAVCTVQTGCTEDVLLLVAGSFTVAVLVPDPGKSDSLTSLHRSELNQARLRVTLKFTPTVPYLALGVPTDGSPQAHLSNLAT